MPQQAFRCVALLLALTAVVWSSETEHDPNEYQVTVPSRELWTATTVVLEPGMPFHIEAVGKASMVGPHFWHWLWQAPVDWTVGPEGTYLWAHHRRRTSSEDPGFPMPTMADGPFPAYSLIGRIGEHGEPFLVGRRYDGVAAVSGQLWLGVNDDNPDNNAGHFDATIRLTRVAQPAPPPPQEFTPGSVSGRPLPRARVMLLYVDGLRPDVVRQMANDGYLPNFRRLFIDGGLWYDRAFTVFPSNTLVANGSLFTGLFPDATGIKSQNQFERLTRKPRGPASEWLPNALTFKFLTRTQVIDLLDKYAPENTHAFLLAHGVRTMGKRLGKGFRFTTLPIVPINPPPRWFHYAVNTLGPFGVSSRLLYELDAVNAAYTLEELVGDPDAQVVAVWLPMVDKTSHYSARGQFGLARRDIVLADRFLGALTRRLDEVEWTDSTYLVLVSDHGHLGGEQGVNRRANLPRDWGYRQLGCNVHVVGQEWTHPGLDEGRFIFFDNQGSGQCAVFLPYGTYFSGPWKRNRLYELTHYELNPRRERVNLLHSLKGFRGPEWEAPSPSPVDLILVKLDATRVLLYRDEEVQAILEIVEDAAGVESYLYTPVRRMRQTEDGTLRHDMPVPGRDPLGYLADASFAKAAGDPAAWIARPHSSQEWLAATADTRYPDAVVGMAKAFRWRGQLSRLEEARDPDILITANEGWSFRSDDEWGTDHGYPLAPSMRICLFVHGPNIPAGLVNEPRRIVDVLPTILDMTNRMYEPEHMDGRAITGIYE